MLYTIIHTPDFINSKDFTWDKAFKLVNDKLNHQYTVSSGTFCKDIERFKMAYDECPTFVPIEGYAVSDPIRGGRVTIYHFHGLGYKILEAKAVNF